MANLNRPVSANQSQNNLNKAWVQYKNSIASNPAIKAQKPQIRKPRKYPTGFEYVFVNGKPALSNGEKTKIFNGNVIRSPF